MFGTALQNFSTLLCETTVRSLAPLRCYGAPHCRRGKEVQQYAIGFRYANSYDSQAVDLDFGKCAEISVEAKSIHLSKVAMGAVYQI
jgi:hypothetical protein